MSSAVIDVIVIKFLFHELDNPVMILIKTKRNRTFGRFLSIRSILIESAAWEFVYIFSAGIYFFLDFNCLAFCFSSRFRCLSVSDLYNL